MKKTIVLAMVLTAMLVAVFPAVAQDTVVCPGALPSRLVIGEQGKVTPGAGKNVRSEPSTGAELVGQIPGEDTFYVNDGPVCADGYTWWMVSSNEVYGWTVEGDNEDYWLEPYPPVFTAGGTDIAMDNVAFSFDPALGTGVEIRLYDAVAPYAEGEGPGWDIHPAYVEFRLVDFPAENRTFKPIIQVYPADEFAAMNEYAAEAVEGMQQLLANDPAMLVDPEPPLIPIFNASRVFQAQTQYLEFQTGAGFRFVTHYAQAFDVFTSENVFYTFQGLTHDGKYWVSIMMPIGASALPETFDYPDDFDWEAFGNNFLAYVDETTNELNALTPMDFTPAMHFLDNMIESIVITTDPQG
jgi:hypothetical protein